MNQSEVSLMTRQIRHKDVRFSGARLSKYVAMTDQNQYLPKYIQNVPWYYKNDQAATDDALYHHRKNAGEKIDFSDPQAGSGIRDNFESVDGHFVRGDGDYDAKRDRWHGHSNEEWDDILAKWDKIKKKTPVEENETDDTDYELELQELGLERKQIQSMLKEDPMEKAIRDRSDVPAYIMAINANAGGKIRLGKDSTKGLVSEDSDFVKESKDVTEMKQIQQFAWEQNQAYQKKKEKELFHAQLSAAYDPYAAVDSAVPVDLNLSVEASPTLMMLKNRENEKKKVKAREEKRNKLLDRYGLAASSAQDSTG